MVNWINEIVAVSEGRIEVTQSLDNSDANVLWIKVDNMSDEEAHALIENWIDKYLETK